MAPKLITLVRHGQAHHNVNTQYHLHDPYLTAEGESQCRTIPDRFPANPPVDLLVTSPLKRTIQTTLIGFPAQIASGAPIIALPELQETSSMPCDTGSPILEIESDPVLRPSTGAIDFSLVEAADGWTSKSGKWSSEPAALTERATSVRAWLKDRNEEHVICVLHGGFLHYLTEDWTGKNDLPGTGWANTEFRSYAWKDEGLGLVETEESKKRREHGKPLGKTEMQQFLQTHVN